MEFDLSKYEQKMEKTFEVLKREFLGLRTGRASTGLLEPLSVEAYGSKVPISQVGNIGVPEPRMLTIQVWDQALVPSVESAIRASNLGLNPMTEGSLIRLPIPDLTEERRKEIVKLASKYAEDSRVIVRNIRREAMEEVKNLEKNKSLSKDEAFSYYEDIQFLTDNFIKKVDDNLADKEKDILSI
tara:strand:- start:99 stop:653 length:555 start_codon:yes stop_codon:yes gene_type:complete